MAQTRECDYCGGDIEPGTGTMYVTVSGTVTHYCSAKCEKNAELGREPRDLEWTAAGGEPTRAAEAEPATAEDEPEDAVAEPPTPERDAASNADPVAAPDLESIEAEVDDDPADPPAESDDESPTDEE